MAEICQQGAVKLDTGSHVHIRAAVDSGFPYKEQNPGISKPHVERDIVCPCCIDGTGILKW